jgi:hypothetical protein
MFCMGQNQNKGVELEDEVVGDRSCCWMVAM